MRYEDQIRQVKEETERAKGIVERAKKVVEELGVESVEAGERKDDGLEAENRKTPTEKDRTLAREKRIWEVIEQEVGSA